MTYRIITLCFCALFYTLNGYAQKKVVNYDLFKLSESKKLDLYNREVSTFSENGKKGIRLSEKENDGIAWLKGITFSNGIIELDIKGKDILQQSFVGIAFHGFDDEKFDAIYFRPFNFKSEDSVRRIHAVQYISLPEFDWPRLRQEQNGKYEQAIIPAVNPNDWFHVKIVVQYPQVSVYVNGEHRASLVIEQLSQLKTGKIGLWVGNNSGGDFANLSIVNK